MAGTYSELTDCPDMAAILDELQAKYVLLGVQPGEFTLKMFEAHSGLSHARAEGAIERACAAGEYEPVLDCHGKPVWRDVKGHPAKVWRRARPL